MITSRRVLPVLSLALVLSGCGGASSGNNPTIASAATPAAGASAGAAAQRGASQYLTCLHEHGVTLITRDGGSPEVDKDKSPLNVVEAASKACLSLSVPEQTPAKPITGDDLQNRRKYAACVRQHGVPEFPDPDPASGVADLTDAQSRALKSNPALPKALEACRSLGSTSDSVSGA